MLEAKAEQAAEAEEGAKAVFGRRVEQEAKAGLGAGVRARAGARRVTYGAKAGPGDPDHEVVVVRRAGPKTKKRKRVQEERKVKGRGAPAAVIITWLEIVSSRD